MHAPAQVSQDSDSERPTKVVSKSRKHSIYSHFPKDRGCKVCLRTNMTRALCRRRTGEAPLRADKFGDLITADHKGLDEGCASRDNHRYALVVQDLNGFNLIRAKLRLHMRWGELCQNSWSSHTNQKLFLPTTQMDLGKHVKIYRGITALQHLIDPRQMASLKEPSDE